MAFKFTVTASDQNKKKLGERTIMHPQTFAEAKLFATGNLGFDTKFVKNVDSVEAEVVNGYMASEIIKIQNKLRNGNGDKSPKATRGRAQAMLLAAQKAS